MEYKTTCVGDGHFLLCIKSHAMNYENHEENQHHAKTKVSIKGSRSPQDTKKVNKVNK